MSRTSILTITAITMLGTTSLVPAHAANRGFAHAASGFSRPMSVARPVFAPHVTAHIAAPAFTSHVAPSPAHPPMQFTGGPHNPVAPILHNNAMFPARLPIGQDASGHGFAWPMQQPHAAPGGALRNLNAALANQPHAGKVLNNSWSFANSLARTISQGNPAAFADGGSARASNNARLLSNEHPLIKGLFDQANADNAKAKTDTDTANFDKSAAPSLQAEAAKLRADAAEKRRDAAVNPRKNAALLAEALSNENEAAALDQRVQKLNADAAQQTQDAAKLRKEAKIDTAAANRLIEGIRSKGSNQPSGGGGTGGSNGPFAAVTIDPGMTPTTPSGGQPGSTGVGPMVGYTQSGYGQSGYGQGTSTGPVAPPVSTATTVPPPASLPARRCLTKTYLQAGTVMFRDVCSQEWAINTAAVTVQTPAKAACLTKENPQDGVVLFKDVCTNEWAMNPPPAGTQTQTN